MSKRQNQKQSENVQTLDAENIQQNNEIENTVFNKLAKMIRAEKRTSEMVLTSSFATDKTILHPFFSLVTSIANSVNPLPKELKGKERQIKASNRNLEILSQVAKGMHLEPSGKIDRLKNLRYAVQAVLPVNFGNVLFLSNSETAELVKIACNQILTGFGESFERQAQYKSHRAELTVYNRHLRTQAYAQAKAQTASA